MILLCVRLTCSDDKNHIYGELQTIADDNNYKINNITYVLTGMWVKIINVYVELIRGVILLFA